MPRKAVSQGEKKALRVYFQAQQRQSIRLSQKQLIRWFEDKFGRRTTQSAVSEYLSDQYKYLDDINDSDSPVLLSSLRHRQSNWPTLERILFEWMRTVERSGVIVSGPLLAEKAHQIWDQLPEYQNQKKPEFSDGWLTRFKKRYQIKQRTQHGEASGVPSGVEEEMKAVRKLCDDYPKECIYNMDETGLFWRQSMSSESRAGTKKDKARITIILCTNYTGSDRLPPWFIGCARCPIALHGINFTALGGVWRANKTAWMSQAIMKEWLMAFYNHVGTREVLLLMDNLISHRAGLQEAPPPANVRIQFLPANANSKFQPLNQGIIQNLKAYYRRQFLRFTIDTFETGHDPIAQMNLYNTCLWAIRAWRDEITNGTMYNCFRKSSILQADPVMLPKEPDPDLSSLYSRAQLAGNIQNAVRLTDFLNPPGEDDSPVEGDPLYDPLLDVITDDLQQNDIDQATDEEEREEVGSRNHSPEISPQQALRAVQIALQFVIRQEDANSNEIRTLQRLERSIQLKVVSDVQNTLNAWLVTTAE